MFFTRCNCRKFKSISRSSPIVEREGVFNLLTPDAARSASVEPIGETQPIVKSSRIFGKLSRSSHRRRYFVRKGVLRNFAKFAGKHLCQSLFFIKKETLTQVFSCEFCEVSKNTCFIEHLWWLLLKVLVYSENYRGQLA